MSSHCRKLRQIIQAKLPISAAHIVAQAARTLGRHILHSCVRVSVSVANLQQDGIEFWPAAQ
jgi:hypothetical protein